jgi:hypothetical protein
VEPSTRGQKAGQKACQPSRGATARRTGGVPGIASPLTHRIEPERSERIGDRISGRTRD